MTLPDGLPLTSSDRARATDPSRDDPFLDRIDRIKARRARLKDRHAQGLTSLMTHREDLRGVHALADLVDDGIRWTA